MNLRNGKSTNKSTVKFDFSKMKKKPVSEPIVFRPTTEEKLVEAMDEIAALKKSKMSIENEFRDYINERTQHIAQLLVMSREARKEADERLKTIEYLEGEVNEWKNQYNSAVDTANNLRERITNPFKFVRPSPF